MVATSRIAAFVRIAARGRGFNISGGILIGWAISLGMLPVLLFSPKTGIGAVLPEDRADLMYHAYDGGGVEVNGPALLVRKSFAEKFSISGSYYVDNITSASPDVISTASKYTDKREETGASFDYLHRDTLMGVSYSVSDESDYEADTYGIKISQDMFGNMTTVRLGYTRGRDTVFNNTDVTFEEEIDRWQYQLGVSQVLTKTMVLSLDYEAISEDGFLNSPYRAATIAGAFVREQYPRTRSSHATVVRLMRHLRPRSSLRLEYRYFFDTWDIAAHTIEAGYNKYLGDKLLLEGWYRFYTQNKASFFSSDFATPQNFMARDKELSTFKDNSVGVKLSYFLPTAGWGFLDKGTINASLEYVVFDYEDYIPIGSSQPYSFNAWVAAFFVSLWY